MAETSELRVKTLHWFDGNDFGTSTLAALFISGHFQLRKRFSHRVSTSTWFDGIVSLRWESMTHINCAAGQ